MGGCSPTTPLKCVNEKERGQEESARSTTEVLTEGIEGLRLHLFRPSSLPAGETRNTGGSICRRSPLSLWPAWGRGLLGLRDSATGVSQW
ncbi:tRNA (guanine(37)-N1)-methyltransferase [Dissostichus eleginoides]|uniref:tRNA (Guanine(37)-N1)-methyltransferase n=1 Tax=Dissostichus eleginoides TaxID=100907 RepID=A0AAD9FB28_DISEL|nr:tRNA (guanine(37)-N1)-methyltransferase [Dissostichus eleginoides]